MRLNKQIIAGIQLVLVTGFFSCRDISTISDPKNIEITGPASFVTLDGPSINIGNAPVGVFVNGAAVIRDTNATGSVDVLSAIIDGPDAANFRMSNPLTTPEHLGPKTSKLFYIRFAPTRLGTARATVTFTVSTSAGTIALTDSIFGTGFSPNTNSLCVDLTTLDFGEIKPTENGSTWLQRAVNVKNCGDEPLSFIVDYENGKLSSPSFVVDNPAYDLKVTSHTQVVNNILTLRPDSSMNVWITLSPSIEGTFKGTVFIQDTGKTTAIPIVVNGAGSIDGYPQRSALADTIHLPFVNVGATIDTSVWVKNKCLFPLTLIYANEDPMQLHGMIIPRVDYTTWPAVIPVGDSVKVEFAFKPMIKGFQNDIFEFQFKEASPYLICVRGHGR